MTEGLSAKNEKDLALIKKDVSYIVDEIKDLKTQLSDKTVTHDQFEPVKEFVKNIPDNYVTKEQLEPIKRIVYGMVGTVLVAFIGALIGLIIS